MCYSFQVNDKNGLNPQQKEAVMHGEGPLLIVAGAGAGKTKTITHRIAQLIETGVPAHRILAVTFTNKAAGEMRERVLKLIPGGRGTPLVTTFHSLGVRLLREFHQKAGIPARFTIWDRDDSLRALKKILETLGNESMAPRAVLASLSREKGEGVHVEEYLERAGNFRERAVARAWEEYEKRLREEGALDFDDLLLRTLRLIRSDAGVKDVLRDRFHHITVDEYQDTNRVQYEIARELAAPRNNICVVGDIDQNIYSWRGADISHLLSFEKNFPGTKIVVLEQNYRSTRTILAAANAVIEKNTRRTPKNLFTENATGEPIMLYSAQNEIDEAWFVAQMARTSLESGVPASEIAILYRENFQSRALEEALLHHDVPYRVIGTRFFERKEVKDVLSYLRAALNPQSTTDLVRIVSVPARGIGPSTLAKMLAGQEASLAPAARAKIAAFTDLLAKIAHAASTLPASEAVRFTLEASGMEAAFKKNTEDGHERLENIHELVNFATRYDFEKPPEGIDKLLEEAALQSDQDEIDAGAHAVSLMTVHASKGLEFDTVFITGLEQGLFPSMRYDEKRDDEEERRLFYVALTRARKQVFLSYAHERMKYGSREYALPSEFLQDIDQRLLRAVGRDAGAVREEGIIR